MTARGLLRSITLKNTLMLHERVAASIQERSTVGSASGRMRIIAGTTPLHPGIVDGWRRGPPPDGYELGALVKMSKATLVDGSEQIGSF